jgi:hypothetical protein
MLAGEKFPTSYDRGATGPGAWASWAKMSAATAALVGVPSLAHAGFIPPAGVSDYRLLFVSYDVVQATSLNICDYDTFVTNEAAMNAALPSTTWSAIVSTAPGANGTPGVSAVDHVSCGA